jgi:hypothetical protein
MIPIERKANKDYERMNVYNILRKTRSVKKKIFCYKKDKSAEDFQGE